MNNKIYLLFKHSILIIFFINLISCTLNDANIKNKSGQLAENAPLRKDNPEEIFIDDTNTKDIDDELDSTISPDGEIGNSSVNEPDLAEQTSSVVTQDIPVDNDIDDDNIVNGQDNCPAVSNENQLDTLGTGVGDTCRNIKNIKLNSCDIFSKCKNIADNLKELCDFDNPSVSSGISDVNFDDNNLYLIFNWELVADFLVKIDKISFEIIDSIQLKTLYGSGLEIDESYYAYIDGDGKYVRLSHDATKGIMYQINNSKINGFEKMLTSYFLSAGYYGIYKLESECIDIDQISIPEEGKYFGNEYCSASVKRLSDSDVFFNINLAHIPLKNIYNPTDYIKVFGNSNQNLYAIEGSQIIKIDTGSMVKRGDFTQKDVHGGVIKPETSFIYGEFIIANYNESLLKISQSDMTKVTGVAAGGYHTAFINKKGVYFGYNYNTGLDIFDITSMNKIGQYDTTGPATKLIADDRYIYLANENNLKIIQYT